MNDKASVLIIDDCIHYLPDKAINHQMKRVIDFRETPITIWKRYTHYLRVKHVS